MAEKQSPGERGWGRKALARLRGGKAPETGTEEAKTTDTEAEPDGLEGAPDIAEKVRFWEEQDRINKELIPRVLRLHELFTQHIEGHHDVTSAIAVVEARLLQRQRRVLFLGAAALMIAIVSIVLSLVL